jgi:uncharacterized protein (TIGR03435 family)
MALNDIRPSRRRLAAPTYRNEVPGRRLAQPIRVLQDELGLKLEAGRIPVDVLVIESVKKPSQN